MNDKVRYGILGTGMIADWLANAFGGCEESELVAVASRDGDRARSFAESHGGIRAVAGYEALIASPDVDAVIVALPNHLHREWTEVAAAAGKHVLCEKPLALTATDVDAMFAACDSAGVLLMSATMYRFQPQMAEVQALLAQGAIGEPRLLRSSFCFPFTGTDNIRLRPETGGGCLFDIGFYPVDFAVMVAGAAPARIAGMGDVAASGVETVAAGALHFPSRLTALFQCAFSTDIETNAEILGTEGTMLLPDPWTARGRRKTIQIVKAREIVHDYHLNDPNAYTLEIDHFSRAMTGQGELMLDREGTRRTIATLEELRRQVLDAAH